MLSDATLAFGESLTTALLGLDELYAAEQEKTGTSSGADLERLVVLNLSTTHRPDAFGGYASAIEHFEQLRHEAGRLPEPDRRRYYDQACASAIAFATWRDQGMPFEEQIGRFLHVPVAPASESDLDGLRREMRAILDELGFNGSLDAQCKAWESKHRVPPDEVPGTLETLLAEAWERADAVTPIPADPSDGMRVEAVNGVPFNAKCDFSIRTIELNIDPILTLPTLRHLAVHEGYPGHYVQFIRRQRAYEAGVSPADGLLSVVNTASSAPFEGIADVGMQVIGWDREPNDRLGMLLAHYRSGIGTRAAWRLHAQQWPSEKVADELARDALIGGKGWVANRMKFISRDDRSALIWSYWQGALGVAPAWKRVSDDPSAWSTYFTYIYDRMHSIETVRMFQGNA
jgi:hypothetical protein